MILSEQLLKNILKKIINNGWQEDMMDKKITWSKDGAGCYALKYECVTCGQQLTYICPRDYYTDQWHNHFECCTHDCLERQFDYDKFKSLIKKNNEPNWRSWVEEKAFKKYPQYKTPETIWEFHAEISKSLFVQRELIESGFNFETAEKLAWGDLNTIDYWISKYNK